jgi:hypothetical protein
MMTVFFRKLAIAASFSGLFFSSNVYSASTADVVFVVDESSSMGGAHDWLKNVVTALDEQLNLANVTNNRFAIIGFGGLNPSLPDFPNGHLEGHTHQDFSTSSTTSAAFGSLVTDGGTEDGYSGIDAAFKLSFRSDAATNIILVTDEDRDTIAAGTGLNFANILDQFLTKKALLNAVVDSSFSNNTGKTALGVDAKGYAYTADGLGGFTKTSGVTVGLGDGTTNVDYVELAIATQGAGWDLNQLRAGGSTPDSFTKAFIDTKVREITSVPLPAAFPLLASGLAGLGFFNRKRKKAAE